MFWCLFSERIGKPSYIFPSYLLDPRKKSQRKFYERLLAKFQNFELLKAPSPHCHAAKGNPQLLWTGDLLIQKWGAGGGSLKAFDLNSHVFINPARFQADFTLFGAWVSIEELIPASPKNKVLLGLVLKPSHKQNFLQSFTLQLCKSVGVVHHYTDRVSYAKRK